MQSVHVQLGDRSYPVYIGSGLRFRVDLLQAHLPSSQILIVSNTTVAPLYAEALRQQLSDAGYQVVLQVLPDGEVYKDLQHVADIFDVLLEQRFDRHCTLLALGGGVVGDMCGFAAACYQRGVNFLQMPTTLLAQVDSSVGGKTGVNHPQGKNMIGAFKQPAAVCIDVSYLRTLPDRELAAGLAEVIKYALIRDADFFDWLEVHMPALLARDERLLTQVIARSCQHKADIVAADELEQGERAFLNLGHTFGHAIESYTGYTEWLHGEAVAAGICMAAHFSARFFGLPVVAIQRIIALMKKAGLPHQPPATMQAADFMRYMLSDKKVLQGQVRIVALQQMGQATLLALPPAELEQALNLVLSPGQNTVPND